MKKIILLFLISLSFVTCTAKSNQEAEQQLFQILKKKDFFRLENLLEEKRAELSKDVVLYIDAHLQNAFNRTEHSSQIIDSLLNNYDKSLNDTLLLDAFVLRYNNLRKLYRYNEAADAMKIAIDKYSYTSDDITKLQNLYNGIDLLKEFPQQKMHITDNVTIPTSLNQLNHIIMSVSNGEQSENFVFDTGASMNVVSENSAQRLGIRVLESSVSAFGVTGKEVKFKTGITDTLWIGNLMFENVVFMVLSDELLSFPEADYIIHGIIGFPVFSQMKEIVIRKNKSITVVANPTKRNIRNMFFDGTHHIVRLEANSDTLLFFMDTGAIISTFSGNYFTANSAEIIDKATKNTMRRGGVDGFMITKCMI